MQLSNECPLSPELCQINKSQHRTQWIVPALEQRWRSREERQKKSSLRCCRANSGASAMSIGFAPSTFVSVMGLHRVWWNVEAVVWNIATRSKATQRLLFFMDVIPFSFTLTDSFAILIYSKVRKSGIKNPFTSHLAQVWISNISSMKKKILSVAGLCPGRRSETCDRTWHNFWHLSTLFSHTVQGKEGPCFCT